MFFAKGLQKVICCRFKDVLFFSSFFHSFTYILFTPVDDLESRMNLNGFVLWEEPRDQYRH